MQTKTQYNNLSYVIDRYVPQHIKDNYPLYYDFIETYFEYLQQNDKFVAYNVIRNYQDWNDVDTTLDDFIDYFKEEYINLPFDEDWGLYIKHYKEIYASKGSSKSLEFFIKLLTGLDTDIYYPNRYLMKSSDGVYKSYDVIFCERLNDINYNDYISTKVFGRISEATGVIEKIEVFDDYVKVYLSSCKGKFEYEPVTFNNGNQFSVYTTNVTSKVIINKPGNNYKLDDIITIVNFPNAKIKINSIYSGRLDKINIVEGGSGYQVGDRLEFKCDSMEGYSSLPYVIVNEVDNNGTIKNIKILYKGYGLLEIPTVIDVISANGTGATFETFSDYAGGLKDISIIYPEWNIDTSLIVGISTTSGINADIDIDVSYQYKEIPYYYKKGSFLSNIFKLQDSYYWQEYSYVLNVAGNIIDKYKEIFKEILHPAGFIFFTNTVLDNYISLRHRYVDSILDTVQNVSIDKEGSQYIELLHYKDRIIHEELLQPHQRVKLTTIADKRLDEFKKIGGSFVTSYLELT